MSGVGAQLLFLLVLTAVVSARPAGPTEKLVESARRQARFGDYSFLCDLLCETVEDSESDCSYLDWMSFDICDTICQDSSSTKTTTPKTITTTTSKSTEMKVNPTEPNSASTATSPMSPTTATSATTTTTTAPPSSEPESAAPAESPSTEAPKDPTPETTPQPADNPPADLMGSSNEVDIITVNLEANSSSAQLESLETTDKAVSWQEFKTRLMPYLPELIKLWCEWREIFSNPTSTSALERLCPPLINETAQPPLILNSIARTA